MTAIEIAENLKIKWPTLQLACISCNVLVEPINNELWLKINHFSESFRKSTKIEAISQIPIIEASRKAYKAFGKDPARYRLSAEALMRRIIKGDELYQINNVVDCINYVSVSTGFSIGGYDANKIHGNISFDIGCANEHYEGLGRGILNIEGLPVLRDKTSAFGSPTSDSERTGISLSTKEILLVVFAFGDFNKLERAVSLTENLLVQHAKATNINIVKI